MTLDTQCFHGADTTPDRNSWPSRYGARMIKTVAHLYYCLSSTLYEYVISRRLFFVAFRACTESVHQATHKRDLSKGPSSRHSLYNDSFYYCKHYSYCEHRFPTSVKFYQLAHPSASGILGARSYPTLSSGCTRSDTVTSPLLNRDSKRSRTITASCATTSELIPELCWSSKHGRTRMRILSTVYCERLPSRNRTSSLRWFCSWHERSNIPLSMQFICCLSHEQ